MPENIHIFIILGLVGGSDGPALLGQLQKKKRSQSETPQDTKNFEKILKMLHVNCLALKVKYLNKIILYGYFDAPTKSFVHPLLLFNCGSSVLLTAEPEVEARTRK